MQQKAAAWREYNEAAVAQLFIEKLPGIAAAVAAPLAQIDRIVLLNSGADGTGADRLTRDMTTILAQVPAVLESLTGLDLRTLLAKVPGLAVPGNGAAPQPAMEEGVVVASDNLAAAPAADVTPEATQVS
jgi:flotillin